MTTRKRYAVTIVPCGGDSTARDTYVLGTSWGDAVERAVRKLYGKSAYFTPEGGLPPHYGQIFKPARGGGSSAVTYRVRIDVD